MTTSYPPDPFSGPARSRAPNRSWARVRLSWGSFSRQNATTSGAPAHPNGARPSGKTRVAKPSSVPSSGFLPLSTVLAVHAVRLEPLRSSPFTVAPRRFAALLHAARVLLELPYRAFPSRGAVPALAGPCFLASSHPTTASAARGVLRGRFPRRVSSLPGTRPEASQDA